MEHGGTEEGIKKFTSWNNGAEDPGNDEEENQGETAAEIPNFGLWDPRENC